MANRLILSHSVGEALIHEVHPVAEQALRLVIGKLGYSDLFGDNIHLVSDFHDQTKISTPDRVGDPRRYRVRAKLNPNVNPATIKWEGSGTTIDLGNGNTLVQNPNSSRGQRHPHGAGNYISNTKASILRDDKIAVDLTDRMVGSSLSMEVVMEFMEEHLATESISRIFQCFSNGDMIGYVDLLYDIPVPRTIQSMLRYLYHLKCLSTTNPYGAFDTNHRFKSNDWYTWLQTYSKKVITTIQNRNRPEHKELVINKSHFKALYLLEMSQEAPQRLDPDGFSVTFNLTVQYARSNRIVLEYPIVVNNNYVEQKYVPMERQIRAAGPESMIMWQNPAVTKLWHQYYTLNKKAKPVMFPFWDPWVVPTGSRMILQGYQPVLVAAFTLDDVDNPEGVTKFDFDVDLASALACKLDKNITYTMRKYRNEVFGATRFVNLAVFADDVEVSASCLDLSDGHTLTIKNRNKNPIYRMVVGVNPKKLVTQTVYQRSHETEVDPDKKYFFINKNKMKQLNLSPWRLLDDVRATHGDVYCPYDSDETIYESNSDTIAQEHTVYHKKVVKTSYDASSDTIAQPGTTYLKKTTTTTHTPPTEATAQAGKKYVVKINNVYTEITIAPGTPISEITAQYGQVYVETTTIKYDAIQVTPGQSLEEIKAQVGEIYTKSETISYEPVDTEPGQSLASIIAQYGPLFTVQETRPEPEFMTYTNEIGYHHNRVWIACISTKYASINAEERTNHGIWNQNR